MIQSKPYKFRNFWKYLTIPPGYQKLLHVYGNRIEGHNLLTNEWDLCIILDACRADLMNSVLQSDWSPPFSYSADSITSLDSATEPWTIKTFGSETAFETIPFLYVTANPYSTKVNDSPAVAHLDEVWRYGWDPAIDTVPPRVVTNRAIHHYREWSGPVMVHYLQPHAPHLTQCNKRIVRRYERKIPPIKHGETNLEENWHTGRNSDGIVNRYLPGTWNLPPTVPQTMWDRLRWGDFDREMVWNSYHDTLLIVLHEVELLLRTVDAPTVVITADHGEAFGEWGLFGHPHHMPFSELRQVPYLVTSAQKDIEYEPETYTTNELQDRNEKLRSLGYL